MFHKINSENQNNFQMLKYQIDELKKEIAGRLNVDNSGRNFFLKLQQDQNKSNEQKKFDQFQENYRIKYWGKYQNAAMADLKQDLQPIKVSDGSLRKLS